MSLAEFRSALKSKCKIASWDASDEEVRQMAADILAVDSPGDLSISEIQLIIANCSQGARFRLDEGADFSDLKLLLSLAKKVATNDK